MSICVKKTIVACLVIMICAGTNLAAQSIDGTKAPLTVADLMNPAKNQKLIGREVTLWYQTVQVKTGSNAFWVGPHENQMVLVTIPPTVHVLDQNGELADLQEGDRVQISGLVVRSPNDFQLKKGWGVNEDDLALARGAGIILMADTIKLIEQRD